MHRIPKDYLVMDLETTGVNQSKDRILEIGVMIVRGQNPIKNISKLLNQQIEIPEEITRITGIDNKMVERADPPADGLRWFTFQLGDLSVVGHNILMFDHPFLLEECKRNGVRIFLPPEKVIDTLVLFKGWRLGWEWKEQETFLEYASRVLGAKVKGLKYNLRFACQEMGVETEGIRTHRAQGDILLTHNLLQKMVGILPNVQFA